MPYLRIFDPEFGSREVALHDHETLIGRSFDCDIVLAAASVSRQHAVVRTATRGHVLEDAGSRSGTLLNGTRVKEPAVLHHGDTIQILRVTIEYRTDDRRRSRNLQRRGDSVVQKAMRMEYRMLPSAMRLRYRVIHVDPEKIFVKGDTQEIRGGGIMIPTRHPFRADTCVELEMQWPGGRKLNLLGRIVTILPRDGAPGMCLKLHALSDERYRDTVTRARRGVWIDPEPIR